jgi:hypothetical protein
MLFCTDQFPEVFAACNTGGVGMLENGGYEKCTIKDKDAGARNAALCDWNQPKSAAHSWFR